MNITSMSRSPRRAAGFTLVEVLLAFVIFALSFAVVLEILAASMRSTVRAQGATEAALLGQSLMDRVGTEIPIAEGSLAGTAPGGYRWELVISPYEATEDNLRHLELAEMTGTLLYWVDLHIEWGDDVRRYDTSFTTVKGVLGERR